MQFMYFVHTHDVLYNNVFILELARPFHTYIKMAHSHIISLAITLVFLTLSAYGFDDDLEDFKLYDDISASEARTFNFSSLGDSLPDG